jgi:hypothetical protein
MAIDRDPNMPSSGSTIPPHGSTIPPHGSTMYDRDDLSMARTDTAYDSDGLDSGRRSGSSFWAFLIGGLVIALGLMAFLFYDGGSTSDVTTTGSTTPRVETPARPTTPPATPATPAAPPAAPAR